MLDFIKNWRESKLPVAEHPYGMGRNYTKAETKVIGEYMDQDVYHKVETGSRNIPVLLEEIPPYFSFSKGWVDKASTIIKDHVEQSSLTLRRTPIKIRFVPQLWDEDHKKSAPAQALIMEDKEGKREVWIRIGINNNKTYATGLSLGEVDFMQYILHEMSELDSWLTTIDDNDPLFDKENDSKLQKHRIAGDADAYNSRENEDIANRRAEKTLLKYYDAEEVAKTQPTYNPWKRMAQLLKK